MTMFFCKKKERIIFGKAKSMEDVSLEDFQKNPIWIFALDEEENESQDETWLKPILNSTDVNSKMIEVYILLYEQHQNLYASACLDIKQMKLNDLSLWINNIWEPFDHSIYSRYAMTLHSIPSIKGENNVKFEIWK